MITDSQSTARPKPKRGRPTAIPEWLLSLARQIFPATTTTRGRQNNAYALQAFFVLVQPENDGRFHFMPTAKQLDSGRYEAPWMLLTELGRLDPDDLVPMAGEVSERKLSPGDAVAFVRDYRTAGRPRKPFSQFGLLSILTEAIDRYTATHDATAEQIVTTLESISEMVSEIDGEVTR